MVSYRFFILLQALLIKQIDSTLITSVGISETSTTVKANTVAQFYAILSKTIPSGGFVQIIFPSAITTAPSTACSLLTIQSQNSQTSIGVTCSITTTSSGLIQLTAVVQAQISNYFQLTVSNFVNPASTTTTDSFQFATYDASGNNLDQQASGITITATPDTLSSAKLSSGSTIVGNTPSILTVTIQTKNTVPQNGKIYIQFPYWNPLASSSQYVSMVNSGSISCTGVQNVVTSPICSFSSSTQILTLSSGFSSSLSSGSTISFTVNSIKNPISLSTQTGFTISTGDNLSGFIDQLSASLTITQSALITTASLSLSSTVVQTYTQYSLTFLLPVPLNSGCLIEIIFPTQITLDSQLTQVQGLNFFGAQRTLSGSIDYTQNKYTVTDGCQSYQSNQKSAILYFTSIQNPFYVMTSDTIDIYIYDSNGVPICSSISGATNNGPKVTTTYGGITASSIVADNYQVNSVTNLLFTIQPQQSSYQDSYMFVSLPSNFVLPSTCQITSVTTAILASPLTCTISNSQIQIQAEIFNQDYKYSATQFLQFKLLNIQIPQSTAPTGSFNFMMYTNDPIDAFASTYYLIDNQTSSNLFQAVYGVLNSVVVIPALYQSGAVTSYTINILITDPIMQNGIIKVVFPSELVILTGSICSNFSSQFSSSVYCNYISNTTLTVQNGFLTSSYKQTSTALSFIISGIQNPRSQKTTSSFSIYTMDSLNYVIDQKTFSITVTMNSSLPVTAGYVTPDSLVVGANTFYTFYITSPTSLLTGDILYIIFPSTLGQPLASTFTSCTGINLQSNLTCQLVGQYGIYVTITLAAGYTTFPANVQIQFKINGIQNPPSTKPTSIFSVSVFDSTMSPINSVNSNLNSFITQMIWPGNFTTASVTHQSTVALQSTSFTFQIQIAHVFPANGQIIVTVPQQVTMDSTNFGCSCSVQYSNPQCTYNLLGQTINITMTQIAYADMQSGTIISFTISGLINPQYAGKTDSFWVTTYTSDGYVIDQQKTGLTIQNSCDYPCLTCSSTSTSLCTSCFQTSKYPLLYNGNCIAYCPYGYFQEGQACTQCDSSCITCTQTSTNCQSCNNGYFYLNNQCLYSCPDGTFENSDTNQCQTCQSPCYTCQGSANKCTSCLSTSLQPYFFNNQCYSQCPTQISIENLGMCLPCDQNCKTCTNLPTVCSSCTYPLKLDKLSMTCVTQCPTGTSVDEGTYCEPCDQSCKTCASTNTSYCLSCVFGLYLNQITNKCVSNCPIGTVNDILEGQSVCSKCNDGCLECQNTTSYCTKCNNSLFFYNFTCVKQCPSNYTRMSSTSNVCVRNGTVCNYGYSLNQYGMCELSAQVCKKGYVLNKDKTKCIPVPGAYIPCLFLILNIGWTIYILKTERKIASIESIITQLLLFYTTLQVIQYIILLSLSIWLGYGFILSLHLFGIISMFCTNIFVSLLFEKKILLEDNAFKHWVSVYDRTIRIYSTLAAFINFKLLKGLYSQAFKQNPHFNASFENTYTTIVKPLFIATIVHFIIQVIPVIIDDIYTIYFIPWGYEIMVLSIDNLIMSVVIFILEIIEFTIHKRKSRDLNQYKFTDYSKVKGQHELSNVMGGLLQDEESIETIKQKNLYVNANNDWILNKNDIIKKSKSKTQREQQKASETALLEDLIRRLKEERKFNELSLDSEQNDPEQNNSLNKKQQASLLTNQGKKEQIENIRGKIESKISQKKQLIPSQSQQQLKPLNFNASYQSLNLNQLNKNQENLESARTEKFNYQQQQQESQSRQASPSPQRNSIILNDDEQFEKDIIDYNQFYEEFKEAIDGNLRRNEIYTREWHSYDDNLMRDPYDEFGPQSDFGDQVSNQSFPKSPKYQKDPQFLAQLELFRERIKSQNQFSNIYAETMEQLLAKQGQKFATRRTQTYEKDVNDGFDMFEKDDQFVFIEDEEQMVELDPDITKNLIKDLIDCLSGDLNSQGKLDDYDDGEFGSSRRKPQTKKRKRDLTFELDDIMGVFDIDDFGNIVLGADRLRDNFNRKVNKHGYLVDHRGNIINQDGQIIFESEELDSDSEIPMPYRFEQRKKQLLKSQEKFTVNADAELKALEDDTLLYAEDEKVEEELEKLKILSRKSSVDSKIGDDPTKFEQQNSGRTMENEENDIINDLQRSKKSNGVNKRDLQMAKAYGGVPPAPKQKKGKKMLQGSEEKQLQRKPTDKMFPSLIQEEERVKKLAMLSQRSQKDNNTINLDTSADINIDGVGIRESTDNGAFDFEKYFREQMNEIQQFRDKDREEQKRNIMQNEDTSEGGVRWENERESKILSHQDSATTSKSIQRMFMGSTNQQNLDQILDPLQELSQMDSSKINQYLPMQKFQNVSFNKNSSILSGKINNKQYSSYRPSKQQNSQNSHVYYQNAPLNQSTLNASTIPEDVSPSNQSHVIQEEQQIRKKEFYLPKTLLKSQFTKTDNKNKRRDSSLSSVGQLTMQGDSRLKGLENIYLKKFNQQNNNINQQPQMRTSTIQGNNKGNFSMRGVTSQSNKQTGIVPRFRPLQHTFVDDVNQMANMNKNDFSSLGDNEDFETVFDGMKRAMNKIEQIREQEKIKGKRMQQTLNASSSAHDQGRLNLQRDNWFS